jgi:hypothetical protein
MRADRHFSRRHIMRYTSHDILPCHSPYLTSTFQINSPHKCTSTMTIAQVAQTPHSTPYFIMHGSEISRIRRASTDALGPKFKVYQYFRWFEWKAITPQQPERSNPITLCASWISRIIRGRRAVRDGQRCRIQINWISNCQSFHQERIRWCSNPLTASRKQFQQRRETKIPFRSSGASHQPGSRVKYV